jgi:LysM repeat protein
MMVTIRCELDFYCCPAFARMCVKEYSCVFFRSLFLMFCMQIQYCKIWILLLPFCTVLSAQKMNTLQYIEEFKYAAMQEMKIYGIPASVTLAQGILESASGNSKLAKDCNNHFGIKCRKNWTGNFCLADDDAANECFRGYANAMESYRDHSLFLKGATRYDFLFALPATDYKAWAHGLRQAGYATNPAYGNIIIGVVERYRLSMYDSMMVLGDDYDTPDTAAGRLIRLHGLPAVIALKSQQPEDIAKRYDMGVWQIYKYNDLKRGEDLKPGEIVYLKPKKRKADVNFHLVKEGETLRDISQQHAVKLKHLEKFNHVMSSQPLRPGELIYLREKRTKDSAAIRRDVQGNSATVSKDTTLQIAGEGDTWKSIAQKTGKDSETLKKNNAGIEQPVPGQLVLLAPGAATPKVREDNADVAGGLRYHTVVAGETVYSISRLYKTTPDSIIRWNNLSGTHIMVGQELCVRPKNLGSVKEASQKHTVQTGETLYQISRRYGVSVEEVQKKNQLYGTDIKPGQILVIP